MPKDNTSFPLADLEQIIGDATLGAENFARITPPVNIHVHSVRKRITDADGISAKAVIDALVLSQILPDDSPEYVYRVTYSQEKGKVEYTKITLSEVYRWPKA